jgi:hypothetical protein
VPKCKYALEVVKGSKVIPINESNNWQSQMLAEYNFALQRFNAQPIEDKFEIKRLRRIYEG